MNPLDNVVVVLDHPKDLVNIAGVVRVMMNTGVRRLRLVQPDEFDGYRITGIAHRGDAIVDAAAFFDDLPSALHDVVYTVGTTARRRTAGLNYDRPRKVAPAIVERAGAGLVAIVFGREDRGLSNDALDRCNVTTMIPTQDDYPSLNLAQACLILLYEVFLATMDAEVPLPRGRRATRPATGAELEEMYAALEGGLEAIQFFKSRKPESVLRTLRSILGQASLDQREARLVAGIGYETRHYVRRLNESLDTGHSFCSSGDDSVVAEEEATSDPDEANGSHGQRTRN